MTRKHCRRKVYPLVNPIARAMEGAAITPDNLLDKLRLQELSAIDAFTRGKATRATGWRWQTCATSPKPWRWTA